MNLVSELIYAPTTSSKKDFTVEQLAGLRHILINDSRDKAIQKGHDFASCGQAGEGGFMMFCTSEGNVVCEGIAKEASLLYVDE